jgi:hypothetical protein
MAISVGKHKPMRFEFPLSESVAVILVGDTELWLPELIERTSKLVVNGGFEKAADLRVSNSCSLPNVISYTTQRPAYLSCGEEAGDRVDRLCGAARR